MKVKRMPKILSSRLLVAGCVLALFCTVVFFPNKAVAETSYVEANVSSNLCVNESAPLDIISELDNAFGTHNSEYIYRLDKVLRVAYGKVYKFRQTHNGVDIPAGDIVVCTDKQNNVLSFFGSGVEPDTDNIDIEGDVVDAHGVTVSVPQTDAFGNTVYLNVENLDDYWYGLYDVVRNIYVVDMSDDNHPRYYYSNTGKFEPIAISAYANVVRAYDFYTDKNNVGISLYGVDGGNDDISGNFTENNEVVVMVYVHYGDEYENANCGYYADEKRVLMYVGDGKADGTMYLPGKAADVIGHEYQHAVSGYVAGFEYLNDSGALNEAFSDIFGALIEGYDVSSDEFWQIGEDCATGNDLRSIKGGTPEYKYDIADKIPNCELDHDHTACRYGGTHQNSTIISHIQYELCQKLPEFFTRERIGVLWYSTLCTLTPKSDFNDFGLRFYRTAQNLGYDPSVCDAIFDSLNDRGLLPVCRVVFLNGEFTVSEYTAVKGDRVIYPQDPRRASDEAYDYSFSGWSEHADTVTADMTIRAEYTRSLRSYNVRFVGIDGKELLLRQAKYGDSIVSTDLTVDYDAENFVFEGWFADAEHTEPLSADAAVTGDITVYGKFTEIEKPDVLVIALCVCLSVVAIACIATVVLIKKHKRGKTD